MPLDSAAERVLIYTLQLEAEIGDDNWVEVNKLLEFRDKAISQILYVHADQVDEINRIEERILTKLHNRLNDEKAEMRAINAALRLTYRSLAAGQSRLQLAS